MKVVILDPYFETLGGGEKVVSAVAAFLSKSHEVTVLVKEPVNKNKVAEYFNLELGGVKFKQLKKEPFYVRVITSRYIKLPGRWKSLVYDYNSLRTLKKLEMDLFINGLYQSSLPSPTKTSIYLCMFPQKLKPKNIYHNWFRKFYNLVTTFFENVLIGSREDAIDSYSLILANSKYTASWVKKYWGRDATVLYPICDDMGPPLAKKHIVLNVGRFFADNGSSHHKKQDEILKAFIKLNRPDWELHLAGSAGEDSGTSEYLGQLEKLKANQSNIYIHPNMPFDKLKKLRQQTAIYWHATGFGYDQDIFPENQEHFGMVTVEAMSAGAVPVVYNSAGQKEVVDDGKNGYLWDSADVLLKRTTSLIDNDALFRKMSTAAIDRSHAFDRQMFEKKLSEIISELL